MVLIACEESQRTCIAFRERGIKAFSADLKPCSGGHPEWHLQGDCREALYGFNWDLVIAHPPCTYLSKAGATLLFPDGIRDDDRWYKLLAARDFFMEFYNYHECPVCIENPVPFVGVLPSYDQIIQPFYFGDPYKKATCLWLYELPPLVATDLVRPVGSWTAMHKSPTIRSKTFRGIANAFADQWGLGYCQKSFF